ncbi:MAG: hypothetical protein ACQSGP_13750, partial [Frankia sp.]
MVLYRSRIKKDIAYLIEARSDAYPLRNIEVSAKLGWNVACDYEVIERFRIPLQLRNMRDDPALADWNALRANFRQRAYELSPAIWDHLLGQLSTDRSETKKLLATADRRYALERDIEDYLTNHMNVFAEHGPSLEIYARQYVCYNGGRADLVGFDSKKKRFVAIELKKGVVDRRAVGQALSYRASLEDEFPFHRRPIGILIGERANKEAEGMIRSDKRLSFIPLVSRDSTLFTYRCCQQVS